MKTITLDIIKTGDTYKELITFGGYAQIERPMFSVLTALESLQGKFDLDNANDIIDLYVKFQESMLKSLFANDESGITSVLMLYGEDVSDYIESSTPLSVSSVKKCILFEISTIEDEFLPYLFPGTDKVMTNGVVEEFKSRTPSEKYTQAMAYSDSYDNSSELLENMIKIIYGGLIPSEALFQDRSFIPALKSIRYSQLSDDIRSVDIESKERSTERPDAYHLKDADIFKYSYKRDKRVISRCYYSSSGILPLLWAEIKFAIENDIFISKCPCGKYFIQNKSNNQVYCNAKCRDRQRKIKDMQNPNYVEIQKLKVRKSRVKTKDEKDKIQVEIDKLK